VWKFFRYIIYTAILLAVFIAAYNIRIFLYVPHLENFLHKHTGHNFTIGTFYVSPFTGSVTFTDVSVDGRISTEKVTVRIGLMKMLRNFTRPINYIRTIEFYNTTIDLNNENRLIEDGGNEKNASGRSAAFRLPESEIKILADNIVIKSSREILRISSTEITVNPEGVFLSSVVLPYEIPFYITGAIKPSGNNSVFNTEFVISSEDIIESIMSVSGTFDAENFSFEQNIAVEKLRSNFFEILDSSGTIVRSDGILRASLSGDFGNLSFERNSAEEFYAKANISLSKLNSDIGGEVESKFVYKNGEGNLALFLRNLSVYGIGMGNFEVSGVRQPDGKYDVSFDYGRSGQIYAVYKPGGIYLIRLLFDGKQIGELSGNLRTGEINVDMVNMPVSQLPIVHGLRQKAGGTVTIQGALNETSGIINFSIINLETRKIGKTDIFGTITRSADIYVFYFYKSDKSMIFNSVVRAGKNLSTDFKFTNTDIANVLKTFGYAKESIRGLASGRIRYEKDGTTDFDIKAYDGSFFGNKFKKFEAKGDLNLSRINISNFSLKGENEGVNAFASGLIGFTNENPVSSLSLRTRKINIGGLSVDSDITFSGQLNTKNEVVGTIAGNSLKVSGVAFDNLRADTVISLNKFTLSDIRSDNGFEGNLSSFYGKNTNRITGSLNLKNTNISGLNPELEAFLNMSAKISGTLDKPVINITASVKNGKYSGIPFSFTSEVSYVNNALRIRNAELLSSKTRFSVKGKYAQAQRGALSVEFENLNETIINKFVGFRTPVTGEFSGKGILYQYEKASPRLKVDVRSFNTNVKGIRLHDVKAQIDVNSSRILVSSATAKIADSEIRADRGSFNIKNGTYSLNLFLVNTQFGPANIFGSIDISGKMNKRKGGSTYQGKIDIKNFWINKHRLSSLGLGYVIKDRRFVITQSSGPVSVTGTVDFNNNVRIENFNIFKSSSAVTVNAYFADDIFIFDAQGKSIDWEILGEIIDSPVSITGKTDFFIGAEGSFSAPEIIFAVKSSKGAIADIPYDSIDLEILSSDNRAEIKRAKIFKKNEINVEVKGFFPFWMDSSLNERMKEMPVDVTYEMDDSKMYLLQYLSGGEIIPRAGKIYAKGSIKGTAGNIKNSGQLNASNGVFDSRTYLDRVRDFNMNIVWDDNNVKINKFYGKSGSGKFNAAGGLALDGFAVSDINIQVFTDNKGIPVTVPQLPLSGSVLSRGILQEYSRGEPKFNINITGTPAKPKISGWVSLENTRFSFPPPDTPSDTEDFLPDDTEFDLELRTAKNTKFENSFADAWINGTLSIRGTYASPKPQGVIETQRGTIKYLGIIFDIISAKIEIIDENTLFVSGEAQTTVYSPGRVEPDTIVLVITRSDIDNLNVRFYSKDDPTMDSQTALAKVTRTEQTVKTGDGPELILGIISDFDLRQQALRLIDSSFATPIARNVLRRTGIADNFRVSYVTTEQASNTDEPTFADLLYGTKYSVEKNITNQLLLGYSLTFDQIQRRLDLRHEVEMRYRLNNNLFLSGIYELESENSMHAPDRRLMLQHQIRFGLPSNKRSRGASRQ